MFGLDGMELPLVLAQSLCTRPSRKPLLVRGDAHTLPFRPGVFGFATCIEVIEHLERPTHLLEELRRVLRPGGVAVFTTPLKHSEGPVRDPYHVNEFTAEQFARILRLSGLSVLSIHGVQHRLLDRLCLRPTGHRQVDPFLGAGFRIMAKLLNAYELVMGRPNRGYNTILAVAGRE
jgi:ubiquinone/menaquinone biosynthesis C-methylase UbiE